MYLPCPRCWALVCSGLIGNKLMDHLYGALLIFFISRRAESLISKLRAKKIGGLLIFNKLGLQLISWEGLKKLSQLISSPGLQQPFCCLSWLQQRFVCLSQEGTSYKVREEDTS